MSSAAVCWLAALLELGGAALFAVWCVAAPGLRGKLPWLLLWLVAVGAGWLLLERAGVPEAVWQVRVSPEGPATSPPGRRTFSDGLWLAGWGLLLVPFVALRLLLGEGAVVWAREPSRLFRVALGWVVLHVLSVGWLLH